MSAKAARREQAKSLIDRAIRKALVGLSGKPRWKFLRFLDEIRVRSDLLRPARFRGRAEADRLDAILSGLRALSGRRKCWIRPVESWAPGASNPLPTFSSLAHHLLAEYPVPPVLLSAWFEGEGCQGYWPQTWFIRAGRGVGIRELGLPLRPTRRMAHLFAHAPAHFPISFALRWAHVRSLGGSDALARAVAATRLGREFYRDAFWGPAIGFLVNFPGLDPARVATVIDYLHNQRFEPRPALIGEDTEVDLDPPQPDLTLKGWTLGSLLRRVERWEREREPRPVARRTFLRWDHSPIGEFAVRDDQGRPWTVRELLNSDELAAEGKAMEHCVATYTSICARRHTTIWSAAVEAADGRHRAATVEVNPTAREVVQAKARGNEEPDDACKAILRAWAARECLTWEE